MVIMQRSRDRAYESIGDLGGGWEKGRYVVYYGSLSLANALASQTGRNRLLECGVEGRVMSK